MSVKFETDSPLLQAAFQDALDGLASILRTIPPYPKPVLIEGAEYQGVWLECAPLEGLIYACIDPQVALNNHRIFFDLQRDDGYLPCWVMPDKLGTSQIQMVVPIAASALELYEQLGDRTFLEQACDACRKWDAWLVAYRDTRKTGLCEAFCEFDTGHDASPRFRGLPKKCPGDDARICPSVGSLPYLAPDLSATLYGGRVALSKVAAILGRTDEAREWRDKAKRIRRAILAYTFDPETLCFYDLDSHNRWVRIRGDALTRVLGEHVVDQSLFDAIYTRQIKNPHSFWTPYPLPSIAADDPAFIHNIPVNSWGGAAQALTALRAPRWFEYYGKIGDLRHLMRQWISALLKAYTRGQHWLQQMNPWTGEFTEALQGYSPAMLVMLDFTARLHGVRRQGETVTWNCQMPTSATFSQYILEDNQGRFQLTNDHGTTSLRRDDRTWLTVTGECCITTDNSGEIVSVTPLSDQPVVMH